MAVNTTKRCNHKFLKTFVI